MTEVTVLFLKLSRVPRTHRRVFNIVPAVRAKKVIFLLSLLSPLSLLKVVMMPCTRYTNALYDGKRWLFRGYNRHLHQRDLAHLTVVESISVCVSRHFYDIRTGLASGGDAGPVFV